MFTNQPLTVLLQESCRFDRSPGTPQQAAVPQHRSASSPWIGPRLAQYQHFNVPLPGGGCGTSHTCCCANRHQQPDWEHWAAVRCGAERRPAGGCPTPWPSPASPGRCPQPSCPMLTPGERRVLLAPLKPHCLRHGGLQHSGEFRRIFSFRRMF